MTTDAEYEAALLAAERDLSKAETAEDIRRIWRANTGRLGHRTLGRLLTGTPGSRLLERRAERQGRDE